MNHILPLQGRRDPSEQVFDPAILESSSLICRDFRRKESNSIREASHISDAILMGPSDATIGITMILLAWLCRPRPWSIGFV
jgi:hypothetical protein